MRTGRLQVLRRLDWWLLGAVLLLLGFGSLMILSASTLHADLAFGDPLRFVVRQGLGMSAGAISVATSSISW